VAQRRTPLPHALPFLSQFFLLPSFLVHPVAFFSTQQFFLTLNQTNEVSKKHNNRCLLFVVIRGSSQQFFTAVKKKGLYNTRAF